MWINSPDHSIWSILTFVKNKKHPQQIHQDHVPPPHTSSSAPSQLTPVTPSVRVRPHVPINRPSVRPSAASANAPGPGGAKPIGVPWLQRPSPCGTPSRQRLAEPVGRAVSWVLAWGGEEVGVGSCGEKTGEKTCGWPFIGKSVISKVLLFWAAHVNGTCCLITLMF